MQKWRGTFGKAVVAVTRETSLVVKLKFNKEISISLRLQVWILNTFKLFLKNQLHLYNAAKQTTALFIQIYGNPSAKEKHCHNCLITNTTKYKHVTTEKVPSPVS